MKLPKNTINIRITIDQDTDHYDIGAEQSLSPMMSEEQHQFYLDALNGLVGKLKTELSSFAFHGSLLREITVLREIIDNDGEIDFEPDEELVDAVREKRSAKILEFKKKLH